MLGFFWSKKGHFWAIFCHFWELPRSKRALTRVFSIYVDVIWPIKAFPFGLVESGASLPCLVFFGQKWTIFRQTPAKTGGPESKKKVHHQVSYM